MYYPIYDPALINSDELKSVFDVYKHLTLDGEKPFPGKMDFLRAIPAKSFPSFMFFYVDTHTDPPRFLSRVQGEDLKKIQGKDFTGKYLDECLSSYWYAAITESYMQSIHSALPAYTRFIGSVEGTSRAIFERLILPIGEDTTIDSLGVFVKTEYFVDEDVNLQQEELGLTWKLRCLLRIR